MTGEAVSVSMDRREGVDRRRRPTRWISRYAIWGGRRKGGRRPGDRKNIYVDRYGPGVLVLVLAILALNVLDAYFTVLYLEKGGRELNPLVRWIMGLHPDAIFFVKSGVIGLCLVVLCIHKTFLYVNRALWGILVFYTALLGYHLYLHSYC
jgi:hypothetical protein